LWEPSCSDTLRWVAGGAPLRRPALHQLVPLSNLLSAFLRLFCFVASLLLGRSLLDVKASWFLMSFYRFIFVLCIRNPAGLSSQ
jgi:hypothetical protein